MFLNVRIRIMMRIPELNKVLYNFRTEKYEKGLMGAYFSEN